MKFKERQKSQYEGPSKYIRLKDGESVTGVLRGEIFEHYIKWVGNKSQPAEPNDPEAKTRYRANMVVFEEGKFVAKILEFGIMLYDHLYELSLNMDMEKTKLKISRKGTGTDTTYIPVPLGQLDKINLGNVAAVDLNVLNVQKKQEEPPPQSHDFGPGPQFDESDEIPF